jgi:DeoR/GlpR family transcriptional regulator of sugar metabolism
MTAPPLERRPQWALVRQRILAALPTEGSRTVAEVARRTGMGRHLVGARLAELARRGQCERTARGCYRRSTTPRAPGRQARRTAQPSPITEDVTA